MTAVTLDNLKQLRVDLATLIDGDPLNAAYEVEQSAEVAGAVWATVMVDSIPPLYVVLAVRVYSSFRDDTAVAVDVLESAVAAVDARIATDARYPTPIWQIAFDNDRRQMVAVALLELGREDF